MIINLRRIYNSNMAANESAFLRSIRVVKSTFSSQKLANACVPIASLLRRKLPSQSLVVIVADLLQLPNYEAVSGSKITLITRCLFSMSSCLFIASSCRFVISSCLLVLSSCLLVVSSCRFVMSSSLLVPSPCLSSLWLCLVYFGDILKYGLDPGLDFGFWKKITPESPSSRHILKFCRKRKRNNVFLWSDTHEGQT